MLALKPTDFRTQQKKYFEKAFAGETLIVSRPQNENVVIISEQKYNAMLKAIRNANYVMKLDQSREQLDRGEVVVKSMAELEAMIDG